MVVRAICAVAIVLLVINFGARAWLLMRLAPEIKDLRAASVQLDALHEGMVDEETGARGYLATGSPLFLQPYKTAQPRVAAAAVRLAALLSGSEATRDLLLEEQARQRWSEAGGSTAVDPRQARAVGVGGAVGSVDTARLTSFMLEGKRLFDAYRQAHARLQQDIRTAVDRASDQENRWLFWSGAVQAVVAAGAVAVAVAARRQMTRRITAPVEALADGIRRIADGQRHRPFELGAAPRELVALGESITTMAEALERQVVDLGEQREQVRLHAARLSTVLAAAREVAGSLSLRYVLRSVADAARGLGVDRVRIWLLKDDDNALMLSFDTAAGPQGPSDATRVVVGTGLVGRTAKYGRPIGPEPLEDGAGHAVAVPLIVGGRVVGALECLVLQAIELGHEVLEILEALAGHAAGALASAQLHEQTAELAVTDPLTHLSNRRAFEADFPNEVDRAQRYQRPLSLISLDLDNFKLLNDRYGHAYGDLVLQQTSQALIDVVRGSDRVYRVGGEEITVLCPETDAHHANALAERLRAAVEAAGGPDAPVFTASLGVAELPRHASGAADLLAAADRALYAAKNDGRNRVASAEPKIPSPSRSVAGS